MAAVISVESVGHVYNNGTVALDDVSLDIGTGLFGLLGSNGAGKSTLMRTICTLLVPARGRVTVGGFDVVKDRRAVRGLLGYLPQHFSAWRLQTVTEVLDTLADLSGLTDAAARKRRIGEVLESVGLANVAHRKVKQLSGGMVRRLGVAQALVHEPKVIVVDEPTVGLDPEERLRFRQLMADLGRDRAIVLSTHIVADLGSGCSDLALLDRGKVAFRGSPAELVTRAAGKVVEITVPESAEGELMSSLEVVARRPAGGQVTVRGVVDKAAPPGARAVSDVTLEEAYLAFMVGRGRRADELAMGDSS
ncbi:MAG TPA: ATP-binding cassette domain-containing protein [Gammaproteobacteria bacterium]|nr:ATP-binding cassette domain-containing protein [Gammaproteobacteria bacterium]